MDIYEQKQVKKKKAAIFSTPNASCAQIMHEKRPENYLKMKRGYQEHHGKRHPYAI